jgi:hypothetical protein
VYGGEGAVINFVCGVRRRRSTAKQSSDANSGELVSPKRWQERLCRPATDTAEEG